MPKLKEWHSPDILKKIGNKYWYDSITNLHNSKNVHNLNSNFYKRIAYDEILASLLVLSQVRKKIVLAVAINTQAIAKLSVAVRQNQRTSILSIFRPSQTRVRALASVAREYSEP